MNVHWFQHVSFEGLGAIHSWIESRGHTETCTRFFGGESAPHPDEIDFLVIMGGPMSVNDESSYPWLVEEKKVVRAVIEAGKPVFGVCLGAQVIASAFGEKVYAGPELEVGWFPVQPSADSSDSSFSIGEEITVLHWHGETFDLPRGSVRLASTSVCRNQAFLLGERVIGTQFHFEADAATVEGFLRDSYEGLSAADSFVQTPEEIREGEKLHGAAIQAQLFRVLDFLAR